MIKKFKDHQGIAMILTILVIGIIVAVTLQFNRAMRSELHAAVNLRDDIMLGAIARSGFNFALAVLYEDNPATDSLFDTWAIFQSASSYSASLFDDGRFKGEIRDLSGRIQINKLVECRFFVIF